MSNETEVRLGLIGLGNMGQTHARQLREGRVPGLRLAAVADSDPARLAAFPEVAAYASPEALIASGAVDAVLIATPHFSHTDLGIAALEAGLHVMMEKPISVHKADCERLLAAHRPGAPTVFAAMFNQRTDPRYRRLKELIEAGALGRLQRVNWIITDWFRTDHYYRSGSWRATWAGEGGGVLLNQCPHQLDLWQWLFGLPQRVIARCQLGRFHDIEVEDSVSAIFEYASGLQGVFITTTGEAPGTNRLEVVGDDGKLVIETDRPIEWTRNTVGSAHFCATSADPFGKPPTVPETFAAEGESLQHVGILRNFVAAIRGEASLIAPAAEGIYSVELANAMLLSSLEDRPVTLPLDSAHYAQTLHGLMSRSRFNAQSRPSSGPVADLSKSF